MRTIMAVGPILLTTFFVVALTAEQNVQVMDNLKTIRAERQIDTDAGVKSYNGRPGRTIEQYYGQSKDAAMENLDSDETWQTMPYTARDCSIEVLAKLFSSDKLCRVLRCSGLLRSIVSTIYWQYNDQYMCFGATGQSDGLTSKGIDDGRYRREKSKDGESVFGNTAGDVNKQEKYAFVADGNAPHNEEGDVNDVTTTNVGDNHRVEAREVNSRYNGAFENLSIGRRPPRNVINIEIPRPWFIRGNAGKYYESIATKRVNNNADHALADIYDVSAATKRADHVTGEASADKRVDPVFDVGYGSRIRSLGQLAKLTDAATNRDAIFGSAGPGK